jgi:hypothetical protein
MATSKIEARGWLYQVPIGSGPTWTTIKGITSFTPNPGDKVQATETTDFDSQGQYEEVILQRGGSLKLEGTRRRDPATGAADPGQAYLDTLAQGLLDSSVGQIRFRHRTETLWRVWSITATAGEEGGGTNDMSKWSMNITRTGAETTVPAP